MSTITIFDPATGTKLAQGVGKVIRTDLPQPELEPRGDEPQKGFTATGTATVSARRLNRTLRRWMMRRERVPRKMKKAAKRVTVEVLHQDMRLANPVEVANGGDVKVTMDVDYRVRVSGRRTRMTERVVAKIRPMLSRGMDNVIHSAVPSAGLLLTDGMMRYEE